MKIAVIGAGSWGTALALLMADVGHDVRLWVYREEGSEDILNKRENVIYLPGFPFPENLQASHDMQACMDEVELVITVVPTQVYRTVLTRTGPVRETRYGVSLRLQGNRKQHVETGYGNPRGVPCPHRC